MVVQKNRVIDFVNVVREFFKELLNYKGKNTSEATLEELLLSGATKLVQGKYLESKAVADNESKTRFSMIENANKIRFGNDSIDNVYS